MWCYFPSQGFIKEILTKHVVPVDAEAWKVLEFLDDTPAFCTIEQEHSSYQQPCSTFFCLINVCQVRWVFESCKEILIARLPLACHRLNSLFFLKKIKINQKKIIIKVNFQFKVFCITTGPVTACLLVNGLDMVAESSPLHQGSFGISNMLASGTS